jgi:hemerythrin superfamily protein
MPQFSYKPQPRHSPSSTVSSNQGETDMPTTRAGKDACDLLDADHKAVRKMFKEYEELTESRARSASQKKQELAQQICQELTVHAQVEEEIFYPAVRGAIKDTDIMDEAEVEHQSAKELIAQIQAGGDEDKIDAKVKVLGEYIEHHVKEERNEIFPKARAARKLDLIGMRDQIETRKEELMSEMGAMA